MVHNNPELPPDVEQVRDATRLIAAVCGELLEEVREVSHHIEERVHRVLYEGPTPDGTD